MEDDDTFDAGRGSFLTRDGRVQLDALLMNGENLRTGGVACVERLRNPIAGRTPRPRPSPPRLLRRHRRRALRHASTACPSSTTPTSSSRASATPHGLPDRPKPPAAPTPPSPATSEFTDAGPSLLSHDTVGAVALDQNGNLAAGTSTGGTLSKAPGRVGDSSLIGCGCYADNLSAAVSLTGWGEPIMKLVLGKWAVDRVAAGSSPQQAATAAIDYLHARLGGHGGIILLGPDGRLGLAHNTPRMAWGIHDANGPRLGMTTNNPLEHQIATND